MSDETKPIFLIDTNILVYSYDTTDEKKHQKAKELLEQCWQRKKTYAISAQNLAEFFVVITKKVPSPLSVEDAEKIIKDIISFTHWKVLHYDQETILQSITLYKKSKKHYWDAVIAATMIEAKIPHIYTENTSDFTNFEKIIAINPMA